MFTTEENYLQYLQLQDTPPSLSLPLSLVNWSKYVDLDGGCDPRVKAGLDNPVLKLRILNYFGQHSGYKHSLFCSRPPLYLDCYTLPSM